MAKKIVIVEDEEVLLGLLSKKLTAEGYDVLTAKNGQEGIDLLKTTKPDLLLLDIIMPQKNGFEVMAEMQRDDELRKIPVIIISNSGQPVELDEAKNLGAKDWLIKTQFDPAEVLEKVKKQIR